MSKSPDVVERLRQYDHGPSIETVHEAADTIDWLRQEVATLRSQHQGYRDEITEHLREIGRLRTMISWKIG